MTTFTRIPWAYRVDRGALSAPLAGIGIAIAVGALANDSFAVEWGQSLRRLVLSGIILATAAWFHFNYSLPIRIEVDEREVRVVYLPQGVVILPRTLITSVRLVRRNRSYHVGICYVRDGTTDSAIIDANYLRGDGTRLKGNAIIEALNRELGLGQAQA